jgi:hypothetical protein
VSDDLKKYITSHDLYKTIAAYVEENPNRAAMIAGAIVLVLSACVFGSVIGHAIANYFDTSNAQI